ncbi:uncharacterized protein [Prorops nasuta]|uniref:uncharacterized protein n=1 Tax=Prorops nasuta TaxID=863751 RepID=UPI0034CD4C90
MGKIKRNIKSKTPYVKKYSQNDVYSALAAIKSGISTYKAAASFNVPRSTLYAKEKEIIPVECSRGPNTYLSLEEEKIIVEWIFYCSEREFSITKSQLLDCVQKPVVELKRETPFKDNRPGRHWFEGFFRRHPEIALIYNLDESAFFLIPKADKILARKGSKSVYKVVNGDEKESLTVLFTVNGSGDMLPPMILNWYERMPAAIINNLLSKWIAGTTERGWMTGKSFYMYVKTKFYPWLVKNNIEFPVILYVDGHVSQLTLPLSKCCKQNKIELIALYPNATHIMQPLDVAEYFIQ